MEIFNNINKNIEYLENLFEDCGDVVKRKIPIGHNKESSIYVIYIDDMVNRETIENTVLENLMINIRIAPPNRDITNENAMEILTDGGITTADLKE